MSLIEIHYDNWSELRDLYTDHKLCSSGYNLLQNFISWHNQNNDEDIKIFSLNGDWKTDGTFLLIHNFGASPHVYGNTLSKDLKRLVEAFKCFDTARTFIIFAFPERIKPAIDAYCDSRHVAQKVHIDITYWYHATKELVDSFSNEVPAGVSLSELSEQKHAAQINDVWPHHGPGSIEFVKRLIRYNPNVGAFDEAGNLIAWCLISTVGALGLLQVSEQHKRRGLGAVVVRYLSKKISASGSNVLAPVVIENAPSRALFEKLGFKIIDKVFWYVVLPATK